MRVYIGNKALDISLYYITAHRLIFYYLLLY